jgi:hypothetical protein
MKDESLNEGIERMEQTLEDMRAANLDDDVIHRYEALLHQAKLAAREIDSPQSGVKESSVDPAYAVLDRADFPRYQTYFIKCLEAIDVDNYTKHTTYEPYDKTRMKRDDATLARILREEAGEKDGLLPPILQIMLYQYFAADVDLRIGDKDRWVERVVYPEPEVNYFPSPQAVLRAFFK